MNQEKIGKFICECRNNKKMTQSELAEKLGVSDKSVGNWENGRNMPDLSLFKPLCDELGITINEFLSGEKIKKEQYQDKFEENIINTIDYSSKKIKITSNTLALVLIIFGIIIAYVATTIFPSDSSWGSIYSVFGGIIASIGIFKLVKKYSTKIRVLLTILFFIVFVSILMVTDYLSVISLKQSPRFCYIKSYNGQVFECTNPFYNVYKVNYDTPNEYIIVDTKKKYTDKTLPIVPFNLNKSGIENIIKYKNKYVGNNSNDSNLINSLPLAEYGYVFKIDPINLGLEINYSITDWYINENYYLEKSLLYNSVSLFLLIDNLDHVTYNFSGNSYYVTRNDIVTKYPNYKDVVDSNLDKDVFNKYVSMKTNDDEFMDIYFKKIFNK